ncbi:hypothetical protein [Streptomyces sp. NPDC053048]|uniref:hypothetical protein n=1 Tax=Streptomyces sp. NPDC053048 TaxID=3365694 RepID=UPI0037D6E509
MNGTESGAGPFGPLRPVFTCVICGCAYLPPRTMAYPHPAAPASPLHCGAGPCRRACADLPRQLRAVMTKTAWDRARPWMDRELSALPERARRRSAGRARPGSARSRLR